LHKRVTSSRNDGCQRAYPAPPSSLQQAHQSAAKDPQTPACTQNFAHNLTKLSSVGKQKKLLEQVEILPAELKVPHPCRVFHVQAKRVVRSRTFCPSGKFLALGILLCLQKMDSLISLLSCSTASPIHGRGKMFYMCTWIK